MYFSSFEEGDYCPECKVGVFYLPPTENCACHINPPCTACTENRLVCDSCGYVDEE